MTVGGTSQVEAERYCTVRTYNTNAGGKQVTKTDNVPASVSAYSVSISCKGFFVLSSSQVGIVELPFRF
jgi:hypothetical protein